MYKDKERDMLRSVLPSTARKGARINLAAIKRRNRRNIRQDLHNVALDPEVWDGSRVDYEFYPYEHISEAVSERRGADNVAALQRWAPSQVKGVRPLDALSKMRGLLPDSTVGRHALTHIDHLPEFCVERPSKYGSNCYRRGDNSWKARNLAEYEARLTALEVRVWNLLAVPGAHRRLNKMLKTSWVITEKDPVGGYNIAVGYGHGGRPLYGHHDIVAFVKHHGVNLAKVLEKIDG